MKKLRVLIACEFSGTVRDAFLKLGHDAMSCDLLPTDKLGPHYQGDVFDIIEGWMPVQYTAECDPDGTGECHAWGLDPAECFCPGPTQDEDMEYKEINGELFARPEDHKHWDLMIAHPPCTYLTCSAEWAYKNREDINKNLSSDKLYGAERKAAREEAVNFFMLLARSPIGSIAIENPVGVMSTRYRKPDQTIQPYEYGHDASKRTCLWLKNLSPLLPTEFITPRYVDGKPRWGNQTDGGQNREPPAKNRWKIRSLTWQGWANAMAAQWG